jgi:hypothetical protein
VIYDNFLLSQWTECAHILVDAQSAVCDAATLFLVLTQIFIKSILLEDSSQSLQVISNNLLIWQSTECAHILEDAVSASPDAATWFSGLTWQGSQGDVKGDVAGDVASCQNVKHAERISPRAERLWC